MNSRARLLVAQAASDRKKTLYLDTGQRSRGLVHDQNLASSDGLGNLDDLLVRDRQSLSGPIWPIFTEPRHQFPDSLRHRLRY